MRTLIVASLALIVGFNSAPAAEPTAYVINTSGETLSRIDMETGTVTNDILTLGSDIDSYPNEIVIRDTLAYILNSGTDEIQIIDLNTETTAGWINLPVGSNPYWMAFIDDRYLYVTLMLDNGLAKIDLTTGQVVKTVEVGPSPEGIIAIDSMIYVAVTAYDFGTWTWGQGKVVIYDPLSDEVVDEILTPTNPQFFDLDRDGKLHLACAGNYWDQPGLTIIIDPLDNSIIDTVETGGTPGQLAITPDGIAWVAAGGWISDGEVYRYRTENGEILNGAGNPFPVDSGAGSVAVYQDGSAFVLTFADIVSRYDSTGSQLNAYSLGDGPSHMDFNYQPGDANGDWDVNVADAVYMLNYIFHGGDRPIFPAWRGDVNADGYVNIGDVVYISSYIFKSGPRPRPGMGWLR